MRLLFEQIISSWFVGFSNMTRHKQVKVEKWLRRVCCLGKNQDRILHEKYSIPMTFLDWKSAEAEPPQSIQHFAQLAFVVFGCKKFSFCVCSDCWFKPILSGVLIDRRETQNRENNRSGSFCWNKRAQCNVTIYSHVLQLFRANQAMHNEKKKEGLQGGLVSVSAIFFFEFSLARRQSKKRRENSSMKRTPIRLFVLYSSDRMDEIKAKPTLVKLQIALHLDTKDSRWKLDRLTDELVG